MNNPDDSFLSRWSRRKSLVRGGAVPPEPAAAAAAVGAHARVAPIEPVAPIAPTTPPTPAIEAESPAVEPPPTLEDVAQLTRDSHYGRFVQADVDPAVKNAALKKLFTEPQFNVMDGLDTYIDDYGKPDPLPASMLRQMAQARFLGLFTDEEEKAGATAPPNDTSVAAASDFEAPAPDSLPNEDTDLRLQPDDAPGRPGAEPGPGPHAGRER